MQISTKQWRIVIGISYRKTKKLNLDIEAQYCYGQYFFQFIEAQDVVLFLKC